MADENFDIMKPIDSDLDVESSIFDNEQAAATDTTQPLYTDTQYGFATKEEAELFSSISESSDSLNSSVGTAGSQVKYRNYNSVADIPPQLRGIVKPENEERKDGEWLPNRKVYFNDKEVHGKKKNRTIIFMCVCLFVIISFIVAGYVFAE